MEQNFKLPDWTKFIRVIAFAWDGIAPSHVAGLYEIEDYQRRRLELRNRTGGGEWAVIVYAVSSAEYPREVHPYGEDNPCCTLASTTGCRVKQLERWNYCSVLVD